MYCDGDYMSEIIDNGTQNVFLNNRCEIRLTGIQSVDSFDETRICVTCLDGVAAVIEGYQLSVKEVNLDQSVVEASGDIRGFFYENATNEKRSFLRSLFRL